MKLESPEQLSRQRARFLHGEDKHPCNKPFENISRYRNKVFGIPNTEVLLFFCLLVFFFCFLFFVFFFVFCFFACETGIWTPDFEKSRYEP